MSSPYRKSCVMSENVVCGFQPSISCLAPDKDVKLKRLNQRDAVWTKKKLMTSSMVRNRKGFIKLALKHGAQLVPVFSFGENELFDQMENPTGSPLRRLQNRLQSIMGVAIPLFHARGVFQYSFGLLPYRKPINTIVGKPIPVVQTPSPSNEDIESLHQVYLQHLNELFEQHKHTYGLQEHQHLTFI